VPSTITSMTNHSSNSDSTPSHSALKPGGISIAAQKAALIALYQPKPSVDTRAVDTVGEQGPTSSSGEDDQMLESPPPHFAPIAAAGAGTGSRGMITTGSRGVGTGSRGAGASAAGRGAAESKSGTAVELVPLVGAGAIAASSAALLAAASVPAGSVQRQHTLPGPQSTAVSAWDSGALSNDQQIVVVGGGGVGGGGGGDGPLKQHSTVAPTVPAGGTAFPTVDAMTADDVERRTVQEAQEALAKEAAGGSSRLKKFLLLFLCIAVIVIAVTAGLSFKQLTTLHDAMDEFRNSAQLSNYTSALLESQLNGETGTRGYQVTGQDIYLQPYDTSLTTTPIYLDLLSNQLGASQGALITELSTLIANLSSQWNITITDRGMPNGFALSVNDTLNLQGKATMDDIRAIITDIQTREAAVVDTRYSDAKSALLFVTIVTAVSLALIVLTVIGGVIIGMDMDSKGLRKHNEQLTVLLQKAEEATALKSVFLAVSHGHTKTSACKQKAFACSDADDCVCCDVLFLLSVFNRTCRMRFEQYVTAPDPTALCSVHLLSEPCLMSCASLSCVQPMNGVLAMTRYLCSMDELSDEQQEILDTVLTSAESMMRLIDDLLLFSKMEAGKFKLCPGNFQLQTLLKPLHDMFSIRCAAKQQQLSVMEVAALQARGRPTTVKWVMHIDENLPVRIYADSDRLRQILTKSAHKHTPGTHLVWSERGSGF